jgi:hypothetical protein
MNPDEIDLRIKLHAFCYACDRLLDYLDDLYEAISESAGASAGEASHSQELLARNIEGVFRDFCYSRKDPGTVEEACNLLVDLIDAKFSIIYQLFPKVQGIFQEYRSKMQDFPVPADDPLEFYVHVGNVLTRGILASYWPRKDLEVPNRKPSVVIENDFDDLFICVPYKRGASPKIIFKFCPPKFTFGSFMCWPFRLFHELYSHAYTADLFSETSSSGGERGVFEDGWLVHAAQLYYEHQLREQKSPDWPLSHALRMPFYRIQYTGQYLANRITLGEENTLKDGYWEAHWFQQHFCLQDSNLFFKTTNLLHSCPWNEYEGEFYDIHKIFCHLIRKLRRGQWKSLEPADCEYLRRELSTTVDSGSAINVMRLLQRVTG